MNNDDLFGTYVGQKIISFKTLIYFLQNLFRIIESDRLKVNGKKGRIARNIT